MNVPAQWRQPLAVGLAVIGLLIVLVALVIFRSSTGWAYDFRAYFDAANRLQETGSPYQAETLAGPFRPGPEGLYLYSPVLAVALLPLADLSFDVATIMWLGLRLGLMIATFALMPVSRTIRFATFGVAALTRPPFEDLNLGNVSVIVTFCAVVAWRYLDRPIAGVAVAASALLRPTMAVIGAWWLLRRRLTPIVAAVLTAAVAVLVTVPFVGIDGWLDYATVLRNVSDVTGVPRNFDVASFLFHLGAPSAAVTGALIATYAIGIGALLLGVGRDRELGFVVTVGASLLLSPLLWSHYMTHIWIVSAFLAARGRPWAIMLPLATWLPEELLGFVAIAATVLPFIARPPVQISTPRSPAVVAATTAQ